MLYICSCIMKHNRMNLLLLKRFKTYHYILVVLLLCACTNTGRPQSITYLLHKPDKEILLPEILTEISGMTIINNNTLACVQDEKGEIFLYNTEKEAIEASAKFAKSGDFEDIARVKKKFFILRSDGTLFKYHYKKEKTAKQETKLPNKLDYEGLCYWEEKEALLIVPKEAQKKHHNIFFYDIDAKKVIEENTIELKHKSIKKLLKKKYGEKEDIQFKPSGIAIHPITKHLYIIASVGKLLLVCDEKGIPVDIYHLDPEIFNQPEGITFNEKGDLYISNEANTKKANILVFYPN